MFESQYWNKLFRENEITKTYKKAHLNCGAGLRVLRAVVRRVHFLVQLSVGPRIELSTCKSELSLCGHIYSGACCTTTLPRECVSLRVCAFVVFVNLVSGNIRWEGKEVDYMYNNVLHSRFIVLKYSDDGKGRK